MKFSAALLLTSAALLTTAAADSASTWLQWSSSSTPAPAPAPAPVTWTDWETTVETVYKTVDNYITVTYTPSPVIVTVTETETDVSVSVSVSVSGSVATVVNTVVATVVNTVVNTVTNVPAPVTVTSVAVSVSVSQSVGTITDTITDTVTNTVYNTVTSVSLTTTTESALSGLVTCPSRIINPTYTTSTPLPTSYLWGCPPGTLCRPPRIGCNFEQNPPADTYYCSPDQCEPVADLPPIDVYEAGTEDVNGTCAWLTPVDDYFNLNPTFFGLNYGIFNIYGQATCSVVPTSTVYITVSTTVVSGTTVAVTVPTTVVEYSNVPTTVVNTVVNTEYSNVPVPTTVVQYSNVPVPTTVVDYVPTTVYETVYVSSSTWGAWNSKVTKRAEVEERGLEKRALIVAAACYAKCNYANYVYQSVGNVDALCVTTSAFQVAYSSFADCTKRHPATGATSLVSVLDPAISRCRLPTKRTAEAEPVAPAFRFARG